MNILSPKLDGQQALEKISRQSLLSIFDSVALAFIQELSLRCIKAKTNPEIVALGFWLRKANIHALQQQWIADTQNRTIKPRGTVFHIAPSNVDTIFVYSWILSLLAGNRNIIRLSSKVNIGSNVLLSDIVDLLEQSSYSSLSQSNILVTYAHNDDITAKLSQLCHVRVIWGGDQTIERVRRVSLPPMASELTFADRYSLSLIKAESFNKEEIQSQHKIVNQFYNDAYWFDQLACSSPKLIVWEGEAEQVEKAQHIFWSLLEKVVEEKAVEPIAALQVQKFATGLWLAADDNTLALKYKEAYSTVALNDVTSQARVRHCGGGFFGEYIIGSTLELAHKLTDKDQTISYFGYGKEELVELAESISSRGIDRIVPIGMALNFHEVWDGQLFMRSFTREVVIK